MKVVKCIHLIPRFTIGGVECAADSMSEVYSKDVFFKIETIFPRNNTAKALKVFNTIYYLSCLIRVCRVRPDMLLISLWRSCIIGCIVKILLPKTKIVLFLHSPVDSHFVDKYFTRLALSKSCEVWADSYETIVNRLKNLPSINFRIISFVTKSIEELPVNHVRPVFMFWGRIHRHKCLCRAIEIFSKIQSLYPEASFIVIGPDDGHLGQIKELVVQLGIEFSVTFLGPKSFDEIKSIAHNASFYLQTSDFEGMAMSVVESMQLGLLPVTTAVGEIVHYCRDGNNAILIKDDEDAVNSVLNLLNDDTTYQFMRRNAIDKWRGALLYKESILEACRDLHRPAQKTDEPFNEYSPES